MILFHGTSFSNAWQPVPKPIKKHPTCVRTTKKGPKTLPGTPQRQAKNLPSSFEFSTPTVRIPRALFGTNACGHHPGYIMYRYAFIMGVFVTNPNAREAPPTPPCCFTWCHSGCVRADSPNSTWADCWGRCCTRSALPTITSGPFDAESAAENDEPLTASATSTTPVQRLQQCCQHDGERVFWIFLF
jgi:hypothetical protein